MEPLKETLARVVIEKDRQFLRFESFSRDLVSCVEGGAPILTTSTTWDRGRDGRGVGPQGGIIICCSLTDEVDDKATSDLQKVKESTPRARRLYFCSSQRLTEKRCDELEAVLQPYLSEDADIEVLGSLQLADLARMHPQPLDTHYSAEIADCIETLRTDRPEKPAEDVQFHLALATAGHSNSEAIRGSLYAAAVRVVLSGGRRSNLGDCCRDLSHHFHLSRQLPPEAVQYHLEQLVAAGEVEREAGRYRLTEAGERAFERQEEAVASNLLDGRALVREHLESELGRSIGDDQFARIWKLLQEKMALLFYQRGLDLVRAVASLLEAEEKPEEPLDMKELVNSLAEAVSTVATPGDQRDELRMAVVDLFAEPTGTLLEWLVRLCASFVSLCSLGLEERSGVALAQLISRIALILDTDVVLSLLSDGESQHESVQAIVSRWRALGGQVYVAAPVLREVAHHAWIAQNDFDSVEGWLPGDEADRLRLIENAFVRGFAELLSKRSARKSHWTRYISQFRGTAENDDTPVAETLAGDHWIQSLPPRAIAERQVEDEVRFYLKEIAESHHSGRRLKIARDKAARDAQLYAAMVSYRRQAREEDPGNSCLLVSSARRLATVEKRFARPEEPHVVITVSGVTHLISLVPNVRLGLGALRALLFDSTRSSVPDGLERLVLRVLRETREVDLPWARRTTLMRDLRNKLVGGARLSGERVTSARHEERVEKRAGTRRRATDTGAVLKASLESLAIDTRLELENEALKRRLNELDVEVKRIQREGGRRRR